MIACIVPDCRRSPQGSPTGAVYAMCPEHTCSALTAAFGEPAPRSWHANARAHQLRTAIVGGVSSASDLAGDADSPLGIARSAGIGEDPRPVCAVPSDTASGVLSGAIAR